jgi:adenylate cyclase
MAKDPELLRSYPYIEKMRKQAVSVSDTLVLPHLPEIVWPYLSNTDILNQRMGLNSPTYQFSQAEGAMPRLSAQNTEMIFSLHYEELPYEWVQNQFFYVERLFHGGAIAYMRFEVRLQAYQSELTRLEVRLAFVPKLPSLLMKGVMKKQLDKIIKVYADYGQQIRSLQPSALQALLNREENNGAQVQALSQEWQGLMPNSPIPLAIADFIYNAPERYVSQMRPFEIAHLYRLDPLKTLQFFLRATKEGWLASNWDVLCISCRGAKQELEHLHEVGEQGFCESCGISYDVGFDDNLELTFIPKPRIRKVTLKSFCAGSPANTPHIVAQFNLWPQQKQQYKLSLPENPYCFKSVLVSGQSCFELTAQATQKKFELSVPQAIKLSANVGQVQPQFQMQVRNSSEQFMTLKLEQSNFKQRIVSAADANSLSDFHEMFSEQLLQSGVRLRLAQQIVMLIRYQILPEAECADVLDIFNFKIREHHGSCIQTDPEQMLVVFQNAKQALACALVLLHESAQLQAFEAISSESRLAVCLHQGACEIQTTGQQMRYQKGIIDAVQQLDQPFDQPDLVLSETFFKLAGVQEQLSEESEFLTQAEQAASGQRAFRFQAAEMGLPLL